MNITDRRGMYIESLIKKHGWKIGAELGVWYGKTYFRLLEECPDLTLIGVDNWDPRYPHFAHHKDQTENRAEVYGKKAPYGGRSIILEMEMSKAAETIADSSLDFVFVDGDHTYEGCRTDILRWLPKIKDSGWIMGHDYLWPGVNQAVKELLSPVNCPVLETDETWARPKNLGADAVTVCCLKAGDKYGPEYVNILAGMVMRNVHLVGYDFVCFTDNPRGIHPHIRTAPLPYDAPKWWGKMGLYMPDIPGINTKRLLFLDLDVVITGPLDDLLKYQSDFAMAKDWPTGRWPKTDSRNQDGQSSAVLLTVGAAPQIWERYVATGKPTPESPGDQEWINREFPGLANLLPERFVQSYKLHNLAGENPPECSVVMFHGLPKPPDCGGWVKRAWTE